MINLLKSILFYIVNHFNARRFVFYYPNLWDKIKSGEGFSRIAKDGLKDSQNYEVVPYIFILLGIVVFSFSTYRYFTVGKLYFWLTTVALISSVILSL